MLTVFMKVSINLNKFKKKQNNLMKKKIHLLNKVNNKMKVKINYNNLNNRFN
jgi:hypothetical protein